jgi:cell division protein FtsL
MQQIKQATFKQFVLAGNRLAQRERIVVSSHVNVENPGDLENRDMFVASDVSKEGLCISGKLAAAVLVVCIIACIMMVGSKIALTQRLQEEYAQLNSRYQAAQAEQQRLQESFSQKSDASGVCYYAVQSLGMRLAGVEETIGVHAVGLPLMPRPEVLVGNASTGH